MCKFNAKLEETKNTSGLYRIIGILYYPLIIVACFLGSVVLFFGNKWKCLYGVLTERPDTLLLDSLP